MKVSVSILSRANQIETHCAALTGTKVMDDLEYLSEFCDFSKPIHLVFQKDDKCASNFLYCRDAVFEDYQHFLDVETKHDISEPEMLRISNELNIEYMRSIYTFNATVGEVPDFNVFLGWQSMSIELATGRSRRIAMETVAILIDTESGFGYLYQRRNSQNFESTRNELSRDELKTAQALHSKGLAVKRTLPFVINLLKTLARVDLVIVEGEMLDSEIVVMERKSGN